MKLAEQIRSALRAPPPPLPKPPILSTLANVFMVAGQTWCMAREGWPRSGVVALALIIALVLVADVMHWRRWYVARKAVERAPREQDPAVWAAAFGASFERLFASRYNTAEMGDHGERRRFAFAQVRVDECRAVADAAVRALHASKP